MCSESAVRPIGRLQNGVEQPPSVRKVVSDRSDRSAHFRTSAASDDASFKLLQTFLEIRMASSAIRLFTSIDIKIARYQPKQRISERNGCDQTKLRPCSDHLPNAFSAVRPIGSNR